MMKTELLYYLNLRNAPKCPPQIPTRYSNYLDKNNQLSEFVTSTDKEAARYNLGIPDIIDKLNEKIDAKVIERGNVAWDPSPVEGHYDKVLSSDTIYNILLKYALKTELDNTAQQIWSDSVNKIENTYNKVEDELNLLNLDLNNQIKEVLCEFGNYTTYINQQIASFKDILELFEALNGGEDGFREYLNTKLQELREFVNDTVNPINIDEINSKFEELKNKFNLLKIDLQESGLTNQFGDSETVGINQKVITNAINRIWDKLEDITGESLRGINMTIDPTYFVGNECSVNISAATVNSNEIFEHIAFYKNGILICEADNVQLFNYLAKLKETSIIKCVAKILGIDYVRLLTVTHYNGFWLGGGNIYTDIMNQEYLIPIADGLRGAYDVNILEGLHFIIIFDENTANNFVRADLNSIEIPFTQSTVTVNNNNYIVFKSINTYKAGTYNIDING